MYQLHVITFVYSIGPCILLDDKIVPVWQLYLKSKYQRFYPN